MDVAESQELPGSALAKLEQQLQDEVVRSRFVEIYRICSDEFSDDLRAMSVSFDSLAKQPRVDKAVYAAWHKQVILLQGLEEVLGAELVRSYVSRAGQDCK